MILRDNDWNALAWRRVFSTEPDREISMFYYPEKREMQFDICETTAPYRFVCSNINKEDAIALRDRLNDFIETVDLTITTDPAERI